MTCVIGIYFNHFTINDHLFKVYVYCLIKNKLVTHKQTLKTEVVILAVVQCVRALSDWHQVEIFHFILTERNFLTSNVHVNASVCTYWRLHKRPTQRLGGHKVTLLSSTHGPDLINSRLIYLLLAQNVNNAMLKVKLKSIVQERVSEHCACTLLCKWVRWNRKCNYSLTKGPGLRNLYINRRYALGKLLLPLYVILKNQTKRVPIQQKIPKSSTVLSILQVVKIQRVKLA